METMRLTLRCGRLLAWREYGDKLGFPIIFMHGNLNSRLFTPVWGETQDITASAGARIIAVDRPGYGESSFDSERTYTKWPADVRELVDHLQLDKYAVLGYSSGGPNALVCAADACAVKPNLPGLAACGLLSTDGPYRKIGGAELISSVFKVTSEAPTLAEFVPMSEKSASEMRTSYESMSKPERRELALADLDNALQGGAACGPAQDHLLEASDWGFELSSVDTVKVPTLLWHGDKDHDVPIEIGRYVAEHLPGCRANFIAGENHTLLRRHWKSILEELVASATLQVPMSV
jgi:pimeloyl-ACP methyl ester carboxylesterase